MTEAWVSKFQNDCDSHNFLHAASRCLNPDLRFDLLVQTLIETILSTSGSSLVIFPSSCDPWTQCHPPDLSAGLLQRPPYLCPIFLLQHHVKASEQSVGRSEISIQSLARLSFDFVIRQASI